MSVNLSINALCNARPERAFLPRRRPEEYAKVDTSAANA